MTTCCKRTMRLFMLIQTVSPVCTVPEKSLPAAISPACLSTTIFVQMNAIGPFESQLRSDLPTSEFKSPRQIFGMRYFCATMGFGWCFTTISRTIMCSGAFSARIL